MFVSECPDTYLCAHTKPTCRQSTYLLFSGCRCAYPHITPTTKQPLGDTLVTATTNFKVVSETAPGKPRIDQLVISPVVVKAGSTFTVSFRITNDGKSVMSGFGMVQFRCPGAICIRPQRVNVRPIQPGQSISNSPRFQMPNNAATGEYTVTVTYDMIGVLPTDPPVRATTTARMQ